MAVKRAWWTVEDWLLALAEAWPEKWRLLLAVYLLLVSVTLLVLWLAIR
jgi:hypothetical protein